MQLIVRIFEYQLKSTIVSIRIIEIFDVDRIYFSSSSFTLLHTPAPIRVFGRLCRFINLTKLKYERVLFDWDSGAMITYLHMIYFNKSSCVGKQTLSIIGY